MWILLKVYGECYEILEKYYLIEFGREWGVLLGKDSGWGD